MSTTIETPQPSAAPPADPTIDEIVAQHLKAAEASGTAVVSEDGAATQGAPGADGAHTADQAGSTPASATDGATSAEPANADEPKADDVSAARARKILAKAEQMVADAEARAQRTEAEIVAELLKAPKAFFSRHGKSIDDAIDASIAEGKPTAAAATEDDNPRLTALERRLEEREQNEVAQRQQAAIDGRKAEISRAIKASDKYPLVNESDKGSAVVDFMIEYHSIHGKPIAWDRAAALVEADLKATVEKGAKKLGWSSPAAKPTGAAAPKDRPGTTSLSGDQRTAAPADEALPDEPDKLMAYLVAKATNGLVKTA